MAFCLEDDTLWDARKLSEEAKKQDAEWLTKRRNAFICGGCEQKTTFVDATKSIQHFRVTRGWEHDADCDFLNEPSGHKSGPGTPLPDRAPAEGGKEVRYADPGPLHPSAASGGAITKGSEGNRDLPVTGVPLREKTGLKALLRNLRNRPDYPPQNLWLDVPARGPATRATDYFQRIGELTQDTEIDGVTRAYWGYVHLTNGGSSAPGSKDALWIYCDRIGAVFTIRLDYEAKDHLYQVMGIEDGSALDGCHVIVEGVMKKGKKLSVNVTDTKKIAFLPKR